MVINMDFTAKDNSLIICPNQTKTKILKELSQTKKLVNIKFMTKEEYKKIYYFSYDDKLLAYLIKKYNYNIDVARVYINNLYVIDENKTYKSPKLNFLKDLKKELIKEGLLIYNNTYKEYLKNKNIIVKNEYNLEKYEEEMLGIKEEHVPEKTITAPVMECNTLEEEVNQVCLEIINLLKTGVDINKIYLTNVSSDYLYTIKSLFSFYHIPININFNYSIYSTKVVKDYLNTKELDLENKDKKSINKKLINILSDLSFLDEASKEYKILLTDKLKNTYASPVNLKNAVTIKDLYKESFNDDEYVFVLGFNQDELPKMEKDISYITDKEKDEVSLYKTDYLNKRNKNNLVYILSNIKNLYLSYKLTSPFKSYYKSSLITDLSLNIVKPKLDSYNSSNIYNELRLASYLDLYHLYGEKNKDLKKLYTHYQIPYKTYSNVFTGINNDEYLTNLPYPLKLSYTSLNAYSECKFKYYIRHVLKLEPYTNTFQTYIGSMYHYILSVYKKTNFNFEEEYQKYLEKRELSLKEKLLLIRIKKDLLKLIDILNKQDLIKGYTDAYYEKMFDVLFGFLSGAMLLLISITPVLFRILINSKFDEAYQQIPILFMGVFFNCIVSFFGGIYVAKQQTKQVGYSSLAGAVINFAVNIAFIRNIGLYAASVSTVVAFLIISIYRMIDVKKYVKICYNYRKISICMVAMIAYCFMAAQRNTILNIVLFILAIGFNLIINKEMINAVMNRVKKKK